MTDGVSDGLNFDQELIQKAFLNFFGSTGDPRRSVWELRKTVEVEVTAWQGAA